MQFTNPIWLWALTGLLIPIGIHLLSRKQGRIIKIGSVRHLLDTSTSQFKSLRLNELMLLVLRCAAIIILTFLLGGLHVRGLEKKNKWLLVEQGLIQDPGFSILIDSLKENGFELKSLTYDINNSASEKKINYWAVVEMLKTKSVEQAVILSYNYAEGFKGKRIALPENIQWITKDPDRNEFVLAAHRLSNDSVALRIGESNPDKSTFRYEYISEPGSSVGESVNLDSIIIELPDTTSIAIVSDPEFEYDKKVIIAALQAIETSIPYPFTIRTSSVTNVLPEAKNDFLIWLSELPPPDSIHHCIYYRKSGLTDENLFVRRNNGRAVHWALTARLNEEVVLRENLTVQLAQILSQARNQRLSHIASKHDRRSLPEDIAWDSEVLSESKFHSQTDATETQRYIAIVLMFVMVTERWISYKRNQ